MGCDIHIVLEKKYEGKWIGLKQLGWDRGKLAWLEGGPAESTETLTEMANKLKGAVLTIVCAACERDYRFFSALAGVRGPGPKPKGIPLDASDLSHMLIEEYGPDGHSHSYENLRDFLMAAIRTQPDQAQYAGALVVGGKETPDDALIHLCKRFIGYKVSTQSGERLEDHRVVFWFDN